MRAVVVTRHGGPEVLRVEDLPDPEPGPGEIVVALGAGGVNFVDVHERQGSGAHPTRPPFVLGNEGAGAVSAVGAGVQGVEPGDRVAWARQPGSYAERVVLPAAAAVPVPPGVTEEDAAAVLLQGMTAQYLTSATYPVRRGDTVLVHAAAGGTGLLVTQLARLRGGDVIATVSTDEKERLARDAGAVELIRYDREDVAAEVARITRGIGVAAVYDGVGAATWEASLASLRPRGTMVLFGAASGPAPAFDPQRLQGLGSLFLTRPTLAHYIATREELLERARIVLGLVATGDLRVRIGGRYTFDEITHAYADLESRRTAGKLLVLPK